MVLGQLLEWGHWLIQGGVLLSSPLYILKSASSYEGKDGMRPIPQCMVYVKVTLIIDPQM